MSSDELTTLQGQILSYLRQQSPRPVPLSELLSHDDQDSPLADVTAATASLVQAGTLTQKSLTYGPDAIITLYTLPTTAPTATNNPHTVEQEGDPDPDLVSLKHQIDALRAEQKQLEANFSSDFDVDQYVNAHIKRLHDYNEIKDMGQMVIGKVAEQEGTTTREMYTTFGLDEED
ncbi:swi5-like zinc finger protein [Rhizophlyctis rosea]|nr:swi5-like zinc finger protein [Rhizophlyctis rosea]